MAFRLKYRLRFAAALAFAFIATPALAGVIPLATYRAVHDLAVDPSTEGGDVAGVTGRLVTEFTGSACAGYTTKTRFVTRGSDTDGDSQVNDLRSTTTETADGGFDFVNETYADDKLVDSSAGKAKRNATGIAVALTRPGKKNLSLGADLVFPTEQMVRILDAARAHARFLSFDLYDGSEEGETVFATSTIIGKESTAVDDVGDETPIAEAGFASLRHWPVTISYFKKASGTDETPEYTMSFVSYENGVVRHLRLNYGKFALIGKLTGLQLLPATACPG